MSMIRHALEHLRARLAVQVAAPLRVSERAVQHRFDAASAAYCEIDVRDGEAFAVVVVLGALPGDAFIARIWQRRADEVWLLDPGDEVITVLPRDGEPRVFARADTLRSARLPGIAIALRPLFALPS